MKVQLKIFEVLTNEKKFDQKDQTFILRLKVALSKTNKTLLL